MYELGRCKCEEWTDTGSSQFRYNHHPACPECRPFDDIREIIMALLSAGEAWAADKDGMPDEFFDAYRQARHFLRMPIPKQAPEH